MGDYFCKMWFIAKIFFLVLMYMGDLWTSAFKYKICIPGFWFIEHVTDLQDKWLIYYSEAVHAALVKVVSAFPL